MRSSSLHGTFWSCPSSRIRSCCRSAPTTRSTGCSRRPRVDLLRRRPLVRAGRARGAHAADEPGDVRHRAPPAPRPPRPAARDPRRSRSVTERPLRRDGAAQERVHRGGRHPAVVPGHRHRDREGQEGRARRHRRRRPRGDLAGDLPDVQRGQPPLLAAGAAHRVRGEEHRHQPSRRDRDRIRRRRRVQVVVHGEGRRLGEQEPAVPGDEGAAQSVVIDDVARRQAAHARHRRVPAVPPRARDRRHVGRVRVEDGEARVGALPRLAARDGQRARSRLSRPRARGPGARVDPDSSASARSSAASTSATTCA